MYVGNPRDQGQRESHCGYSYTNTIGVNLKTEKNLSRASIRGRPNKPIGNQD